MRECAANALAREQRGAVAQAAKGWLRGELEHNGARKLDRAGRHWAPAPRLRCRDLALDATAVFQGLRGRYLLFSGVTRYEEAHDLICRAARAFHQDPIQFSL